MSTRNELIDVLIEITAAYTVERDAFVDCSTDSEGEFPDPHDRLELVAMNAIIDRAEHAIKTALVLL